MTIIQKGEPMSDLISRQAAIDALGEKPLVWDDLSDFDLGKAAQWSDDVDAIKELPSAQPELIEKTAYIRGFEQGRTQGRIDAKLQPTCNQLATDCISRQAAIDAIEITPFDDYGDYMRAKELIEQLPSAQPQRIKGRWIDVTKTGGAELWKCSECGELELEDSYYCPNCGAEMRGKDDAAD